MKGCIKLSSGTGLLKLSRKLGERLRVKEGACEARKERGGAVCERDEAEPREILPQAGGKSVLSAKVLVWLWKKETADTGTRRFLLPACVAGGRAWMV